MRASGVCFSGTKKKFLISCFTTYAVQLSPKQKYCVIKNCPFTDDLFLFWMKLSFFRFIENVTF